MHGFNDANEEKLLRRATRKHQDLTRSTPVGLVTSEDVWSGGTTVNRGDDDGFNDDGVVQ